MLGNVRSNSNPTYIKFIGDKTEVFNQIYKPVNKLRNGTFQSDVTNLGGEKNLLYLVVHLSIGVWLLS